MSVEVPLWYGHGRKVLEAAQDRAQDGVARASKEEVRMVRRKVIIWRNQWH